MWQPKLLEYFLIAYITSTNLSTLTARDALFTSTIIDFGFSGSLIINTTTFAILTPPFIDIPFIDTPLTMEPIEEQWNPSSSPDIDV